MEWGQCPGLLIVTCHTDHKFRTRSKKTRSSRRRLCDLLLYLPKFLLLFHEARNLIQVEYRARLGTSTICKQLDSYRLSMNV